VLKETDLVISSFTFDLGPDGSFVEEQLSIQYTCAPVQLTIQGYLNGNSAGGPDALTS
jgi:hypothetical protein